ncbi:GNAT family N-acetyltransferase [Piscinibacter sakaiensis]|uniref:Acetyltransferase, GNAT family n=1 Tax=Piscinibacter sakaiensis TaxID=1547922 RepID=A0A0K8NZU8_PISS1|nr:GNAT family N-acetyltransferase [Piscinibacter sakaiensis]GAP35927.1 acetyltransferase, GNAT family [Piscinibacter sakaiensis]
MSADRRAADDAGPAAPAGGIAVRRAGLDDAAALARIMGHPQVYRGLLQLPYADEALWRGRLAERFRPDQPDLLLVAELDGRVEGSAGLHPDGPNPRRRHAMYLGISVHPEAQGRGVGSALMAALCELADRWLGLRRLELTVFVDNARAIALYERFGFVTEGRLRGYALRDGRYEDVLTMARCTAGPVAADGPGR